MSIIQFLHHSVCTNMLRCIQMLYIKQSIGYCTQLKWKTLLNPFIILCSFNYEHVLYFVFLVLSPLCHINYFKLCELLYFEWVLIREMSLLLVELLKRHYLFKCGNARHGCSGTQYSTQFKVQECDFLLVFWMQWEVVTT